MSTSRCRVTLESVLYNLYLILYYRRERGGITTDKEKLELAFSPVRIPFKDAEVLVDNYNSYETAISLLEKLKAKGKVDFDFSSLDENFETHKIVIHWIDDGAGYTELDEEDLPLIREIFSNKKALIIDHVENTWTVFAEIFKEKTRPE